MGTFANTNCDDEVDDSLSFKDLDKIQKLFQEQFQDVLKQAKDSKSESVEPQVRKEFSVRKIAELCSISKQQQEKQKQLLGRHKELTENLEKVKSKICELEESHEKLEKELLVSNEELKQSGKPLVKAIKKYSENLDMTIEVKDSEIENQFIASVKFCSTGDSKPIHFSIDRKQRCLVDFDASSVLTDDEALELKRQVLDESNKIDSIVLVKTLRERCVNTQ